MLLIVSERLVSKISKIMDVNVKRDWNIFNYWITNTLNQDTNYRELTKTIINVKSNKRVIIMLQP